MGWAVAAPSSQRCDTAQTCANCVRLPGCFLGGDFDVELRVPVGVEFKNALYFTPLS